MDWSPAAVMTRGRNFVFRLQNVCHGYAHYDKLSVRPRAPEKSESLYFFLQRTPLLNGAAVPKG
jgi:hypothetical protein